MRLPLLSALVLFLTLGALNACATSERSGSGGSGNVLESEAIEGVSATDAYQAIQNLRPRWLRSRGQISIQSQDAGMPVVYVDGMSYGDVGSLRQISTNTIEEIEFISASDATTRFGTGHAGGVIMVRTKR